MYTYLNYGLKIESEIEIPEFSPADQVGDVSIKWGNLADIPVTPDNSGDTIQINSRQAVIRVSGLGTCLVEEGRHITAVPAPNSNFNLFRRFLIGNVFGILLYQRGFFVLHASSVRINGHTIAIAGDVGRGKSTLAASLYARGHDFLGDDIAAVNIRATPPIVIPAYPQIKLLPDYTEAIGVPAGDLVVIDMDEEKKGYPITSRFVQSPQPLEHVYFITEAGALKIEPCHPQTSMLELIRYSIPTRWKLADNSMHFQNCVSFANKIEIFSLKRPRRLEQLAELIAALEQHVSG